MICIGETLMKNRYKSIISQFKYRGLSKGSEFLLTPTDALDIIDELTKFDIGILGVNIWQTVEKGIMEILGGLNLSKLFRETKDTHQFAQSSAKMAIEYITNYLPDEIDYVSFVTVDDLLLLQ